jgi:hypothetical protein
MGVKRKISSSMKIVTVTVLLLFLSSLNCFAQYNEDVIKAAYIERITRFIEWPFRDSLSSQDPFVIGVYNEDEFYYTLTEVFKDKPIKGHIVKIITVKSAEQIRECNLCYISAKAKSEIRDIILKANTSGVLLVSGTTGFCKAGVHINFYIEDEKLKFEINEKTLGSAGFKVSYLLMQNTKIIQ